MVEGTGLENRHTGNRYREFESHPVRVDDETRIAECGGPASSAFLVPHCVGWVAEWLKAHAWKACGRETVSRVRISPHPLSLRVVAPQSVRVFNRGSAAKCRSRLCHARRPPSRTARLTPRRTAPSIPSGIGAKTALLGCGPKRKPPSGELRPHLTRFASFAGAHLPDLPTLPLQEELSVRHVGGHSFECVRRAVHNQCRNRVT